ncbi:hypothetical protein [Rhodocyclus purpureus]|uniref:hypothetical protein n=1 Tax=Rhodocyclus purpureus TaxID=1067 RepID=UPI0019139DA9|nr:hypothetical protein [Rhodocyclus purpureus]MBK5913636.1 hypothetical protein [Rhodocyclus purpureus]
MHLKSLNMWLPSIAACGLLVACSTVTVGSEPGATPPQLVSAKNADGQQVIAWDNPSAFGPVPAALAAKGQAVCGSLDTEKMKFEAIGYHPHAKDVNGKPFDGGGYFCVRK